MKLRQRLVTQCAILLLSTTLSGQITLGATFNPIENQTLTSENLKTDTTILDYTNLNVEGLLLPKELFILEGTNTTVENYTIFNKNAFLSQFSNYNLNVVSSYGIASEDSWSFKTGSLNEYPLNKRFDLNFYLSNDTTLAEQNVSVELVDTSNTTPVRLLAIGDSLTRAGIYLNQVEKKLPNVKVLGTRVYETDGISAREGRGGWTLNRYFTAINSSELDSPFMFPTTIDGARYKGNTRDWKNICYTDSTNPIYAGFQTIARDWKSKGPYLYDMNGYYKYPLKGDVMVDPSRPKGSEWIEWTGTSWESMAIQPTTFEFSFSKYMERFAAAYTEGAPTHVSILLGANDFGYNNALEDMEGYIRKLNQMIASIKAYDPHIKIILCTPTPAPNTEIVTDSHQAFYNKYDRNMKIAIYYLLKTYDNEQSKQQGIYIAPMHLTLDTTNGFDYKETTETIDGATIPVIKASNGIHPNNSYGQLQMGDTLAAVIQKYR